MRNETGEEAPKNINIEPDQASMNDSVSTRPPPSENSTFQAQRPGFHSLSETTGRAPNSVKSQWKHKEGQGNKYLGKRIPPNHNTTFVPQGSYDIQTVYELMTHSEKNPIQLLHEYCSRVKKNVTYQFDVRDFTSRPKKEHYVCSIRLDNNDVIAMGDAASKRDAKNIAGEKALTSLIAGDDAARA